MTEPIHTPPLNWGILGPGAIAGSFAAGLRDVPNARLVAVGSRSAASAARFGAQWQVPNQHASYAALAADPDVQAIYIATPHPMHYEHALLCIEAGKHVLCEKPFTLNARQAEGVIAAAQARGVFLMEAMWTRFLPHIHALQTRIASNTFGELRMLRADFCFRSGWDPNSRLLNPALGGGALLDVGVYPVSLAHWLLGPPTAIHAHAHIGSTNVDEQAAIVLTHANGALSLLSAAVRTSMPFEALVAGTAAAARLETPWWGPSSFTILRSDAAPETVAPTCEGNGYGYQAAEVARCVAAGLRESPVNPLADTLAVMRTLDAIRAQWGLVYPGE